MQNSDFCIYIEDEKRKKLRIEIELQLQKEGNILRLVGLSGLGKTRLAFEVFNQNDNLSKDMIYIDIAQFNYDIVNKIKKLIQYEYIGIIVLDNCNSDLHSKLENLQNSKNSKIKIITLDYNISEYNEKTLTLEYLADESIKQILKSNTSFSRLSDIDKIVQFANGFPQIAVMLANSKIKLESNVGILQDEVLANKMLWGNSSVNENEKTILEHFAILDKCNFNDGSAEEFKFLIKYMNLDINESYKTIINFIKKGIIDQRGKYIKIVPKPLALTLATSWWDSTRNEKIEDFINSDMPDSMQENLCLQIEKLYLSQKIQNTIETLCTESAPFGQAKKILTIKGSRLFRSFAIVNSDIITSTLSRVIHNMTNEEIYKIDGDIRRNLVWTLIRLCFRKETFLAASKMLVKFAVCENESWSNNSIGEFKSLFPISLANTEAEPQLRLQLIDELINLNDKDTTKIIIDALDSALETNYFMRTVGSENNSLDNPLKPWEANNWQDIYNYYNEIIKRLITIMLSNDFFSNHVKKIFSNHLRDLFRLKRIDSISLFFNNVATLENSFYQDALESIDDIIEYDLDEKNQKSKDILDKWKILLSPQKIEDKLQYLISVPPYRHLKDNDGKYIDIAYNEAKTFASECSLEEINKHIESLIINEQRQAYTFGKHLIPRVNEKLDFIKTVVSKMTNISDKLNINFLKGLLSGLKDIDHKEYQDILNYMQSTKLIKYYADLIIVDKPTIDELLYLVKLINEKKIDISTCRGYANGQALNHLTIEEIQNFLYELTKINQQGVWIALDIGFMYNFSTNTTDENNELFKDIINQIDFTQNLDEIFIDFHDLEELIKKITKYKDENKFIENFITQIFDLIKSNNDQNYMREVKSIFLFLLNDYSSIVFPVAIKEFYNLDSIQKYKLEIAMKNFNSDAFEDDLIDLIDKNLLDDVSFITFLMGIFQITNKDEDGNHKDFTNLTKAILEKYSSSKETLRAISSNLNTYSWSGSTVPYYENLIELMMIYQNGKDKNLKQWAENEISYYNQRIEQEKIKDEEYQWGIY